LELAVFEELVQIALELVAALMVEMVEVHPSLEYLPLVVVEVEHEIQTVLLVVLVVVEEMLAAQVELVQLDRDSLEVADLE
jgi:hypothetical protein